MKFIENLTTFYVTICITGTDPGISVLCTAIILTSKRRLHLKERPYLIFLKVVQFLFSRGTRFFAVVWWGGTTSEIRGNRHRLPPMRSPPKPHVCRVIWGVLSLYFMSALREMVPFVFILNFDRSAFGRRKVRFRPVRGIE